MSCLEICQSNIKQFGMCYLQTNQTIRKPAISNRPSDHLTRGTGPEALGVASQPPPSMMHELEVHTGIKTQREGTLRTCILFCLAFCHFLYLTLLVAPQNLSLVLKNI